MGLSELLRLVAEKLGALGLPYFVTGSVASTYFGDLRFTNDIDIVADWSGELGLAEIWKRIEGRVGPEGTQSAPPGNG